MKGAGTRGQLGKMERNGQFEISSKFLEVESAEYADGFGVGEW